MSLHEQLLEAISHIRVFCMPDDWARTAAFYKDQLGLAERYSDVKLGVVVFDCGDGPTIGVEQVDPADPEDSAMVARFTGVSFRVADIDAAFERLSGRRVVFDRPPEKMYWGGTIAHFRDPAGNTLTLVEYASI